MIYGLAYLSKVALNEHVCIVVSVWQADDRDGHRRTALHVAAEAGHVVVVSALLQNGADFDATDAEGDNALHIAVREGQLSVARTLLTESRLDAETLNLKGRNPLHTLARYAKDNAASICELFIECMPEYPLDKPDLEGNTGQSHLLVLSVSNVQKLFTHFSHKINKTSNSNYPSPSSCRTHTIKIKRNVTIWLYLMMFVVFL